MTAPPRVYRWSALSIGSDVALPLPPSDSQTLDLQLQFGPRDRCQTRVRPRELAEAGRWYHTWWQGDRLYASFARKDDSYLVRFADTADVWIDPAAHVIRVIPHSSLDDAIAVTMAQGLPLAASASGRLVLHASAVDCGAGAVAFVGPAGAGKSTLAAALARAGCAALADDCVVCGADLTRPEIVSIAMPLRLAPDAAALFGEAEGEPDRRGKLKLATSSIPAPQRCEPRPLIAVCALDPEATHDRVALRKLSRREAVAALLPHTYRLDTENRSALTKELDRLATLATVTPVIALNGPRGLDRLDGFVAELTARFVA